MNKQRDTLKRELSPNELLYRFERSKVVRQLTERLVVNGLYSSDAKNPKNRRVVDIKHLTKADEDVDHEVLGKELRHVFNNNDRIRRLARVGIVYYRHSDKIVTPGAFVHLKPDDTPVQAKLGLMTRIQEASKEKITHARLMEWFSKVPETKALISFIVNNKLYHLYHPEHSGAKKLIRLTTMQSISSTWFAHEELVDELKNAFGNIYYYKCLEAVGITYCPNTGRITTPGWNIDTEEYLMGKTPKEKAVAQSSVPKNPADSDTASEPTARADTCAQFIRDLMVKKWKIKFANPNGYQHAYPQSVMLEDSQPDLVLGDLLEQFSAFPNYAHTLLEYDIVIGYKERIGGEKYRLTATLMRPEGNIQAVFSSDTASVYDLNEV